MTVSMDTWRSIAAIKAPKSFADLKGASAGEILEWAYACTRESDNAERLKEQRKVWIS